METQAIDIEGDSEPIPQEQLDNPFKDFGLQRSVPFFSFCDPRKYEIEQVAPLPKYLTPEEVLKPLPSTKAEILSDYREMQDGGLVCVNKEAMAK